MNTYRIALLLSTFLYLPLAQAKLAATEWGTFTSLLGSNGVSQDGMYHEDEELPSFVRGFGELVAPIPQPQPIPQPTPFPDPGEEEFCGKMPCRFRRFNVITQKMETPVIYFYSDRETSVTVDVKFPEGMVTETFPGPISTFPNLTSESVIANGHTTFNVKVHPLAETVYYSNRIPHVPAGNIYGHARRPNSSVVQANLDIEKFIFYRGVGRFTPRTSITSHQGALALHQCSDCGNIPAAFLVDVDRNGHARILSVGNLAAGVSKIVKAEDIQRLREHGIDGSGPREMLTGALNYAGLTPDEALAMIDTWENGYLKVPGLRLLYILPRQEVDAILPVTITPQPDSFTRVFVGRLEILLDTDEQILLDKILAARDLIDVRQLGRFGESTLRRLAEVLEQRSPSQDDRDLLQRLIERAKQS